MTSKSAFNPLPLWRLPQASLLPVFLIYLAILLNLTASGVRAQTNDVPAGQPPPQAESPPPPSLLLIKPVPPPPPQEQILAPLPEQFDWMSRQVRPNPLLESILALSDARHRLLMSVSLTEAYSSNYGRTEENPESEYLTIASIGTVYRLAQGRSFLSLANSISAQYEARREDSNIGFVNLSLNAGHRIQRLSLALNESFVRDENLSLTSPSGVRGERQTITTNRANPQLAYAFNRLTSMNLGYTNTLVYYQDDPDDTVSHTVNTGLQHRFSRRLIGSTSYAFTTSDRRNADDRQSHTLAGDLSYALSRRSDGLLVTSATATTRKGGPDSQTYETRVGIRHRFTPLLNLFVTAGATVFDLEGEGPEVYGSGRLQLAGTLFGAHRTHFTLALSQSVVDTTAGVNDTIAEDDSDNVGIVLRQTAALTIDHMLTRALRASLTASATRSDFLEDTDTNDTDEGDVLYVSAGAGAAYALSRIWSLSLNYQYQWRNEEEVGNDFEEHQVRLSVSAGLPIF